MLEVEGLAKAFGGLQVTRNVSLTLAKGERRVILGPNGAGKTTLFNLLVGVLQPSAGDIRLDGVSIVGRSVAERARLGISRSYQKNNLFESLTVRQNLALAWLGRDTLADTDVCRTVEEVARRVALSELLDMPVRTASYGARRQLEVGIALATGPRLLLMDEPTSGVGPTMMAGFKRLLAALPEDLAVLIIEHDIDLAFEVADRVTVLNFGEVVFEGTAEEARSSPVVREIYLGDWAAHAGA